jgi:plasmid stabilization system protein ParE
VKFRIIVLPQAQEDLLRNAEWWAKHQSADKAAEWLDVVQEQLETIVNFPESHPISE